VKKKILVVGAGFAGAVIARELANTGEYEVDLIDKRGHIGGNAYDTIHKETGALYHNYGPHIFHTNDKRIFDYLSQFTEWVPYRHRVEAHVDGVGDVPIPINITTLNRLYNLNLSSEGEFERFLDKVRTQINKPSNALEFLTNIYGKEITDIFFARYTLKMWGLELSQLPTSVVARIPIRKDNNPDYFNDKYQFMPKAGYTSLFKNMLSHPAIKLYLNQPFNKSEEEHYHHIFNSMPIDEYYDYCFGELPYRSIIFEHRKGESFFHSVPTVNFTNKDIYTRKTNWLLYPNSARTKQNLITYETPCDFRSNNNERYYPLKSTDDEPTKLFRKYFEISKKRSKISFIGRCGQYVYYDMHQVVANSLMIFNKTIIRS